MGAEKNGGWVMKSVLNTNRLGLLHLVFNHRCGHGGATTCDGPLGSDSRTVPLKWRGSDKRGGG